MIVIVNWRWAENTQHIVRCRRLSRVRYRLIIIRIISGVWDAEQESFAIRCYSGARARYVDIQDLTRWRWRKISIPRVAEPVVIVIVVWAWVGLISDSCACVWSWRQRSFGFSTVRSVRRCGGVWLRSTLLQLLWHVRITCLLVRNRFLVFALKNELVKISQP